MYGFCFSFVVFAYYNAVLTSLMTATPAEIPIRNFKDVSDRKMSILVWKGSASLQRLKNAPEDSAMGKVNTESQNSYQNNICISLFLN